MLTSLQGFQMDEKGSTVPYKTEAAAPPPEDGTPSKPRQAGSGNGRKQPRAAKQLRFEGAAGMEGLPNATAIVKIPLHMWKHGAASQHSLHPPLLRFALEHTHVCYPVYFFNKNNRHNAHQCRRMHLMASLLSSTACQTQLKRTAGMIQAATLLQMLQLQIEAL